MKQSFFFLKTKGFQKEKKREKKSPFTYFTSYTKYPILIYSYLGCIVIFKNVHSIKVPSKCNSLF